MKLSKIFLTICVIAGVAGWTATGGDFVFGILRPLSAVFFILFFACSVVEAAQEDHEAETQPQKSATPARPATQPPAHGVPSAAH